MLNISMLSLVILFVVLFQPLFYLNSEDYDDDDFDYPLSDIRIEECYLSIPEGT